MSDHPVVLALVLNVVIAAAMLVTLALHIYATLQLIQTVRTLTATLDRQHAAHDELMAAIRPPDARGRRGAPAL